MPTRRCIRFFLVYLFLLPLWHGNVRADALDSLRMALSENPQIQEKVYVQTDNNCYFVGDTLWYKAFVLRADDHKYTDMSKLLYVELLSPDGVVAERQRIVVSDKGVSCGQFVLHDSLYGGYYEIRAYTRWMLNFNVSHRHYSRDDRHRFYTNAMAEDFFREWDGLYSRVLPVFSKPAKAGEYSEKYMYGRPKQEMPFAEKTKLKVSFYPEGGTLLEGVRNRVAFEVTDNEGQALQISGKLDDGTPLTARHMGRGTFTVVPSGQKAIFEWNGKTWDFKLPKAEDRGVALTLEQGVASWTAKGVGVAAYAVMCRGRLYVFERTTKTSAKIPLGELPAGVCELMLLDINANVLASRLFFADRDDAVRNVSISTDKLDYMPYEPIQLNVSGAEPKMPLAISVRDGRTDDTTYDDGDIATEMLLCSDLKGFIASPAYYFESRDDEHARALDNLMMVQGWRRYEREPMLRYTPEQTLTFEGTVNKQLSVELLEPETVRYLTAMPSVQRVDIEGTMNAVSEERVTMGDESAVASADMDADNSSGASEALAANSDTAEPAQDQSETSGIYLGVNHGTLKHEVLVEAELSKDGKVVGAVQKTKDNGHFLFEIPPYYGKAVLMVKAYNEKDSVKKSMENGKTKHMFDEEWYPDYYVRQDLFFPVFAHPYNWYQTHQPEWRNLMADDTEKSELSKLDGDHTLSTVEVDARRRGRRSVDYSKPAYVADAYDLYNEATDRGLSWGMPNMGTFPEVASFTVYGNMNRYRDYNVKGRFDDGYVFFMNYSPIQEPVKNRSDVAIFNNLHLKRIKNIRLYTDYEPRNPEERHRERLNDVDVTVSYELLPNDATRYTYCDRRYIFDGIAEPVSFYNPDYSKARPTSAADYRRTLYWNSNAMPDDDGNFSVTLYNNSRETRARVAVGGVTSDGKFVRANIK